ncbi:MAG: hypothetical protein ACI9CV_001680 [Ilumatobacter sp.]|jgi:hypothetical protein
MSIPYRRSPWVVDGMLSDRSKADGLRTLCGVSATEEDLDSSTANEVVDEMTPGPDQSDGSSTTEIDASDELLVESLEESVVDTALGADGAIDAAVLEHDDLNKNGFEDDHQTLDVPAIVFATEVFDEIDDPDSEDTDTGAVALERPTPDPEVSYDILEELRRADIDGPVVDAAPQDACASGRRRPKEPVYYDPAPVPVPLKVPRLLGRKARVRKVTRVVRHVDPWSVFKVAITANMVLYLTLLTAAVLLWNVAYATGTIENVERFFESFGWQSFEFNGGEIYHAAWIAGLFGVLGLTGLGVLLATLFNLITDLVGGVRFTVLEEEVVESRSSPMRRFVVRRPEPEIPAVLHDVSGPIIREAIVDDIGDIER